MTTSCQEIRGVAAPPRGFKQPKSQIVSEGTFVVVPRRTLDQIQDGYFFCREGRKLFTQSGVCVCAS